MTSALPTSSTTQIAQIIQLAVAPVFLLAGVGAFLNVCAGRLARIVDRARGLEPRILASRGAEHDRLIREIRILDKRMGLVSQAIFMSVLAALLICTVVVLLFAASLTGVHFGTAIALLFIASMITIAGGFAIFLVETRLGSRSVRIRSHILEHEADPGGNEGPPD
jgi:MFS family permease